MSDKSIRDEVAELAEAVRDLKDREVADTLRDLRAEVEKLRAERGAHHCHGCSCTHVHWYPNTWTHPATVTYPSYVTFGSGVSTVSASGSLTTNAVGVTTALSLTN